MTKPTKFEQTHIAMVLDRSGSMESCREATIGHVNKYLQEARADALLKEADFELLIFDNQSIDSVRSGAPVRVADISMEDFVPRGLTPLFDAIGRGVDSLDGKLAKSGSSKAILVIVTDGAENASRRYNHAGIKELLKGKQDKGWMVVFLGAGLDSAQQGIALGVNAAYTANISMDANSLSETSSIMRGMTSSYASNRTGAEAKSWMAAGGGALSMSARKKMGDASGGAGLVTGKKPRFGDPGQPGFPGGFGATPPPAAKADTFDNQGDDAWGK